jgi:hypothetical protein
MLRTYLVVDKDITGLRVKSVLSGEVQRKGGTEF